MAWYAIAFYSGIGLLWIMLGVYFKKAWITLKQGGLMIAIAPLGFTFSSVAKLRNFKEFMDSLGTYKQLPDDTFKASGTSISTTLIQIQKP